jgi:hypothetical protein
MGRKIIPYPEYITSSASFSKRPKVALISYIDVIPRQRRKPILNKNE